MLMSKCLNDLGPLHQNQGNRRGCAGEVGLAHVPNGPYLTKMRVFLLNYYF